MSSEEIAGIRADYERILSPETCEYTSPKEPDFSEIVGDCDWEQKGVYGFAPSGRVSKTDPRFGVLNIGCITGSVDGIAALNATDPLVSRAGKSGPFTNLMAHVIPGGSQQAGACATDRRWPIPAAARVSLRFCLPFPYAHSTFLGPGSL